MFNIYPKLCLRPVFSELKSKYENPARDELVSYNASVNAQGFSISQNTLPGQLRLRFWGLKGAYLLQVFHDRFSVHRLLKYPGWNQFSKDLDAAWELLRSFDQQIDCNRIGVRYINKLNEKMDSEPIGKWLKQSPYYPEQLLSTKTGFFYRGQWLSEKTELNQPSHI